MSHYRIKPIAYATNVRTRPSDDHWGEIVTVIELDSEVPACSLARIEDFSHLEIIYCFHLANQKDRIWAGHPREDPDYPFVGIFAQRKKDRPNSLGLCTVELIKKSGRKIWVRNFDGIDGSPIIDIKPVFRQFEPSKSIRQPEWVDHLMQHYW
ncbi:TrmO family methyltransferase [Flavihumibacter rivuli]|uniref:TrmO family methyltransferase domain-containing protein n=1 Tax=Flavihumibacter rivuli TaxID=2838156 RepID=UPI001BDE5473|nr:TrmO family methyltransferase [Flavihumibacter rivuli]ULQ55865.1 TrmO family methyltransferase [Flavihumibacter rivuli]